MKKGTEYQHPSFFFARINLRKKLMFSYLLLILLPLLAYMAFYYYKVSSAMQDQIEYSSKQQLEQTSQLLADRFDNIEYLSEQILNNGEISEILERDEGLPLSPELMGDMATLQGIISKQLSLADMYKLTLYVSNDIFYSRFEPPSTGDVKMMFSSIDYLQEEKWYTPLMESGESPIWLPPSYNEQSRALTEQVVSYIRTMRSSYNYQKTIAIIRIDILASALVESAMYTRNTENSGAVLVGSGGEIMAIVGNTKAACVIKDNILISVDKENFIVYSEIIKGAGMRLISITPKDELHTAVNNMFVDTLWILVAVVAVAYGLAYLISLSFSKRIRALTENIRRVQVGDYSSTADVSGSDEISELAQNFNYMLGQLDTYSRQQYMQGRELKNSEIKALRAQINPHFLYNTLELINWKALGGGLTDVSEIVRALAKYYRLTLSKGKELVSIDEELEHVKTFVQLYNYRHDNAITLVIHIDPGLGEMETPALILQPLVENSILHGIMETEQKRGTVWIAGKQYADSIVFTICDDGVGMAPEKRLTVMRGDSEGEYSTGYGIKNVEQRIKLFYGEGYGLSYHTTDKGGCEVMVSIGIEPLKWRNTSSGR